MCKYVIYKGKVLKYTVLILYLLLFLGLDQFVQISYIINRNAPYKRTCLKEIQHHNKVADGGGTGSAVPTLQLRQRVAHS